MDTPVDFVFYRQFWTLQRFFCDPTQCYRDDQWKVFRKCSETVLSSFKAFRLDDVADADSSSSTDSTEYFAKFLTSSKLFRLQQSDSHFRRQILVQMLVLFQYLTGTVKFKKDNFNLSNAQSDWITKMQRTCFHLIKLSPPSGEQFALDVKVESTSKLRSLPPRHPSTLPSLPCPLYLIVSCGFAWTPPPPIADRGSSSPRTTGCSGRTTGAQRSRGRHCR